MGTGRILSSFQIQGFGALVFLSSFGGMGEEECNSLIGVVRIIDTSSAGFDHPKGEAGDFAKLGSDPIRPFGDVAMAIDRNIDGSAVVGETLWSILIFAFHPHARIHNGPALCHVSSRQSP